MHDGFISAGAGSVDVRVADTGHNAEKIKERIAQADEMKLNLLVLPELCVTAYTCQDLFFSSALTDAARACVEDICAFTRGRYPLVIFGAPLGWGGRLYNCAVAAVNGEAIAVVPKTHLPNYAEFYEMRHFASARTVPDGSSITLGGKSVPFGARTVLRCAEMPDFAVGIEICEDLWAVSPPGERLCLAGATVIANPSASNETVGKAEYRRALVSSSSAREMCGYVYACAGMGESTQDLVFAQHHLVCENGAVLAENPPFGGDTLTVSEIDVQRLVSDRRKSTGFEPETAGYAEVFFRQALKETPLSRYIAKNPFVPAQDGELSRRAELILDIQARGLARRVEHTGAKCAVVGVSGGLDSTLALLAAVRAFDTLGRSRGDIAAVTMPCFGTTRRTRSNAEILCRELGVGFRTVDITDAVRVHLRDIGHDESDHSVTYENAQARERTQVLMDIANELGGLVVGTGDLSELALGWATYNGDHMSMYGVNASVPKTLVRCIVRCEAEKSPAALKNVLLDILATPVSPELLPAREDGSVSQPTEELVGPYELHDFFLYNLLRFGFAPRKILRLAEYAFSGEYDADTIKKWLRVFLRRFFSQQFKRSCLPDGPKVGSAALSPRGDWRMPSDACADLWLRDLD